MIGKVLSTSTQMYVSKAFLPRGRRPHVKQLCARTCPVLPVQSELCKNISRSDRYHFVKKHPREYYKKRQYLMFQQPLCQERCSPAFLLTCRKWMIIPGKISASWYCSSTSPRLLSMPFTKLYYLRLCIPLFSEMVLKMSNKLWNFASRRQ